MTDRRMISTNLFECSIAWRLGSEHPDLLGIAAQRVFQMLILLADDFGRGRYIPALIRVRAFSTTKDALADISDKQIEDWIGIMVDEGAVELYQVGDQMYYSLTGWEHYQRGNWRPRKSNIPAPGQLLLDTKRNNSDESKEVLGVMKGREEKGKEEKGSKDKIKLHCPAKNAGRTKAPRKREKKEPKPNEPSHLWLAFYQFEFKKRKGHEPNLLKGDKINAYQQYNALVKIQSDKIIRAVTKYYLDQKDEVWEGHKPHVLFKNFDRLLDGMERHQAKREKRADQGDRISSAQTAWEREQADMQSNPDEIPDKYKPEATPDEN